MFACALYPRDPAFLGLAAREVSYQAARLSAHASVVMWGGNNENEGALTWFPASRANRDLYASDYVRLYVDVLRPALLREVGDPWPAAPEAAQQGTHCAYVDSSPSNGALVREPMYVKRWGAVGNQTVGACMHACMRGRVRTNAARHLSRSAVHRGHPLL